MKNITRILSAALALCLLAALCLPARADGTQDCGAKLLAITFDDGPGKYTGALLDGLAERGVHATFFVNGVNASGWPETLKLYAINSLPPVNTRPNTQLAKIWI